MNRALAPFQFAATGLIAGLLLVGCGMSSGHPAVTPTAPPSPSASPIANVLGSVSIPGAEDVVGAYGSVWVVQHDQESVERVDPATRRVVATIPVGSHPGAILAAEGKVWTANYDGTISVIDPTTNTSHSLGNLTHTCGLPAVDGGAIWVYQCDVDHPQVSRVDIASGKVTVSVPAGDTQGSMVLTPQGLWLATFSPGHLELLDPVTGKVLRNRTLPGCPTLARNSVLDGGLWVGQFGDDCPVLYDDILKVDPQTGRQLADIHTDLTGPSVSVGAEVLWLWSLQGTVDTLGPDSLAVRPWTVLPSDSLYTVQEFDGSAWGVGFDEDTLWDLGIPAS